MSDAGERKPTPQERVMAEKIQKMASKPVDDLKRLMTIYGFNPEYQIIILQAMIAHAYNVMNEIGGRPDNF